MNNDLEQVVQDGFAILTAAIAKERSQAVVQRESDKLLALVMTEVDKATTKGSFRAYLDIPDVPANVCRHTMSVLKNKGFAVDVNGGKLRVSWGGMDNE